ncbi:hypothetical protein ACFVYC_10630 [Pseudarthrobacter sp. NPDC058329]|uniref:hypothetical protein n=1 Tax=Pseudarthrobacter sp. NPDC058329 TaxID=3346448 RepID=UPI0036DB4736
MHLLPSEYSKPSHVLIHVSDPHFVEEGLPYGGPYPQMGLVEVLDALRRPKVKALP